jgi:hypothetical protein
MATIDTYDIVRTRSAVRVGNPFAALASALQGAIEHQKERHSLARLSRLPDHVVRDMGFDPDKVAAELEGTWDEVEPTRFQRR